MKKHVLFWGIIASTCSFVAFVDEPLKTVFDFVIAGVIPGMNVSLAFIPSLILIFVLLLLIRHWAKSLGHQMMERRAKLAHIENTLRNDAEAQKSSNLSSRQSVVRARALKRA